MGAGRRINSGSLRSEELHRFLYAETHAIADLAVGLFDLLSLFLVTQTRPQNTPLYLIFRMQLFFLSKIPSCVLCFVLPTTLPILHSIRAY